MKERICQFLVSWVVNKKTFLLDTELVSHLNLDLDLNKESDFLILYKLLQETVEADALHDQPFLCSVLVLNYPHLNPFFKKRERFETISGYGSYLGGVVSSSFAIEQKNRCIDYWEVHAENNTLNTALEKYLTSKFSESSIYKEVNYIELRKKQKELGDLGELFVLNVLKRELTEWGKGIDHSKILKVNDIEGYDFRSIDKSGNEIFVEVKTTTKGKDEPFFLSRNEYRLLKINTQSYYLYRVYDFDIGSNSGRIDKIAGVDLLNDYEFDTNEFVVCQKGINVK